MTNKNRVWVCVSSMLLLCVASGAEAAPTAASSLEKCQKTAQKETAKLVKLEQKALSGCLQKIAQKVVKGDQVAVDVSGATATCIGQFYKIGRSGAKSLAAKMAAKVGAFCDPSLGAGFKGLHTADDVLGTGAPGVNQPLDVSVNNDTYCAGFATGSATLAEWTASLQEAASCEARQQVLVEYPRAIEWLNLMDTQFGLSSDSRATDARAALQAAVAAMDSNADGAPDLACGPAGAVGGAVAETGQTQCDQGAGTSGACPGSPAGQDGALRPGLARSFTDNGNGTVTDNVTGLMWEKLDDNNIDPLHDRDTLYTWHNAFNVKIVALNAGSGFAGYTDWRMPTVTELQSIVNYGAVNPTAYTEFNTGCAPSCAVTTCSCTRSNLYWSSTTYQLYPSYAWYVGFNYGHSYANFKPNNYNVRAVRGGS